MFFNTNYYFFRYINKNPVYAKSAYIGLALPGHVGSWQYETKVRPQCL